MAGTLGLHGRNGRPASEPASGARGIYTPAQVNKSLVEKELMKFIGEIANWRAVPRTCMPAATPHRRMVCSPYT